MKTLTTILISAFLLSLQTSCKRSTSSKKEQTRQEAEHTTNEGKETSSKSREPFKLSSVLMESVAHEMKYQATPRASENYLRSKVVPSPDSIKLEIWVKNNTPMSDCKMMTDKFTRLVKSLSNDSPCGKKIGRGLFDYDIAIFNEDDLTVLNATKKSNKNSLIYKTK